uniref:MogA/MoaB family molybdenum cofactor biosynthesis protein n=1 Tax=Staphylothermus marinus TaxID=2280 RepID=A0A7C4DBE2_STAMA
MVKFSIIIVSDAVSSGARIDTSGLKARELIEKKGHVIEETLVISNSYREIVKAIRTVESDVLVFIGGTGLSPRDITVDVVKEHAWREVPGFGEYFRLSTASKTGLKSLLSRASLFILPDSRIAVVLPGSPNAVEDGLNILLEIIEHVLEEARRFEGEHRV